MAREVVAVGVPFRSRAFAVRGAHEDRRPPFGQRLAVLGRQVDIGRQPHAVAHRHHDVVLPGDFVRRLGRSGNRDAEQQKQGRGTHGESDAVGEHGHLLQTCLSR